ncbi:unnamed protein product [Brassica rapa subsp. narinosa]|uniref:(rape) hypothetical protein n=1 Tax=Brassica napus TaxID=3708 RepID=A0A816P621_BRANA|nr:unnamed protein product [Brassica napus]
MVPNSVQVPQSLHWPALLSWLRQNIMEVVYDWAKGSKFMRSWRLPCSQRELSLNRMTRRMEEVLQKLIVAGKFTGKTA